MAKSSLKWDDRSVHKWAFLKNIISDFDKNGPRKKWKSPSDPKTLHRGMIMLKSHAGPMVAQKYPYIWVSSGTLRSTMAIMAEMGPGGCIGDPI